MTDTATREELVDRADMLAERLRDRVHQDIRAALNEVQIIRRQRALDEVGDVFEAAQRQRRSAEAAETSAREALDQAEVPARWEVSGRVQSEGNKFYVPDGEGSDRRQVTAAVRDEWIETQVRQHPGVVAARAALRKAEHATAEAKDVLERARQAIGIRRTQAELAIAHLNAICGTLRSE